jgi:hypothetical protein
MDLRHQLESSNTNHVAAQIALAVLYKAHEAANNKAAEVGQGIVKCNTALVDAEVSHKASLVESKREGS